MRRMLMTISGAKCPFRCAYCFADFDAYQKPLPLDEVEHNPDLLTGIDVVYPACDVDLFALPNALDILWRTARLGKSISVSTKARLSEKLLRDVSGVAEWLAERGRVLKVGISFSTKRQIPELEGGTAAYERRLENLRLLRESTVSSCVVLKPILARVPIDEYIEIVEDTAALVDSYLLGDRYLDPGAASSDQLAERNTRRAVRRVEWATGQPTWAVEVAITHTEAIKRAIVHCGRQWFDSDLGLLEFLLGSRRSPQCSGTEVAVNQ